MQAICTLHGPTWKLWQTDRKARFVLRECSSLVYSGEPEKRLLSYFFKALKVIDVVNQYCWQSKLKLQHC